MDAANNDFSLLQGSPAIDKGINSLLGTKTPTLDITGKTHPSGTGYHLRLYEFNITTNINKQNLSEDYFIFSLFPNPAKGTLNILLSVTIHDLIDFKLVNSIGELVYSKKIRQNSQETIK